MKSKKKIPSFWWDFDGTTAIRVESDNDKYPVLAVFDFFNGDAVSAIRRAEKVINDLNTGRLSMKNCCILYGTLGEKL